MQEKDNKPLKSVELIKISSDYLASFGIESARLDAEVLLAHILGVDRIKLYVDYDRVLLKKELSSYRIAIAKRAQRIPLAYITGHKEFMSLDLSVSEGVLIPRSDTEILVETVGEYLTKKEIKEPSILDLCTGSGAVACALASIFPNSTIKAVDISPIACEVAQRNVTKLGFSNQIEIILGDLFKVLKENSKFDVIVSNPPYIPSADIDSLQPEVAKCEPRLALDGGEKGMDFVETIIRESSGYLNSSGLVAIEIGTANQASDGKELLSLSGFKDVKVHKDLSGSDRVISGKSENLL